MLLRPSSFSTVDRALAATATAVLSTSLNDREILLFTST